MEKKVELRRDFNLFRFIMTLLLIGIMFMVGVKFMPSIKNQVLNIREFALQLSVKKVNRDVNQILKYSEDIAVVPRVFVIDTERMDTGLNYLMVSPDGKKIVNMKHNGDKFVEKVVVKEKKNIRYEMFFEKSSRAGKGNIIKYVINAYIVDGKENIVRKVIAGSSVEPVNSYQVVDKGTGIPGDDPKNICPSIALVYRSKK